jgi:hypothetical protein
MYIQLWVDDPRPRNFWIKNQFSLMDEVVNPRLLIIAPILITPRASHQECRTGLPPPLSPCSLLPSLSLSPRKSRPSAPLPAPSCDRRRRAPAAAAERTGSARVRCFSPLAFRCPPLPSRCAAGRVPRAPPGGARSGCHVWLPSQGTTAG